MPLNLVRLGREIWRFGSHERESRGTPIVMQAETTNGAGDTFYTGLRVPGGAAGRAVTAGQVLVVTRAYYYSTTANFKAVLLYGDTDVGLTSAAAPTNAVQLSGVGGTANSLLTTVTARVALDLSVYYEIPAGKFPTVHFLDASAAYFFMLQGHEVPA